MSTLRSTINGATDVGPEQLPADWRDSGEPKSRFTVVYPDQITLRELSWLVQSLIPRRGFGLLFGPSGCGKSFLGIDIGLKVALGLEVLGKKTEKAGVLYVAAEDAEGVQKRVVAWMKANGIARNKMDTIPFAIVPEAPDLWDADAGDADALVDLIKSEAEGLNARGATPGLVIFDTLRDVTPGMDENNSDDMSRAVHTFRRIGMATDTLVMALHHVPKGGDGAEPRGSTALIGAADVALAVKFDERTGTSERLLWMRKQRNGGDARGDTSLRWGYQLDTVEFPIAENSDRTGTSCVVRLIDPPDATSRTQRLTKSAKIVLSAIKSLISERKTSSFSLRTDRPDVADAVDANEALTVARSLGISNASSKDFREATRKAFGRAKDQLIAQRRLVERDGWLWLPSTLEPAP